MVEKFKFPTDDELEELSFDKYKELLANARNNPDSIKESSIKSVKIVGNKVVKILIKSETIEKGVNLIKGWKIKCPECGMEKIVYNPWLSKASQVCGCMGVGSRGGDKEVMLEKKSLNDTGIMCQCSDEKDNGSTQSSSSVFFGLDMLEKKKIDLDELENSLLTETFLVTGIIRVKQGKEKNVSDYFFDVIDFKIYKKKYVYNTKEIQKFKDVKKDNYFFDKYYCPEIVGRTLSKKTDALLLCQPHRINDINGNLILSFGTNQILGDPGLAKSVLATKGFCRYSDSPIHSAGSSSKAGILAGVQKGVSGRFILSPGIVPRQNNKAIVLDEYGKLAGDDITSMNTIESEGILDISKCGVSVQTECVVNKICIGNLKYHVKQYSTKHRASFDLATGKNDISGKNSGAGRRRKNHIIIVGNEDMSTREVTEKMSEIKKIDFDDFKYWNNLNQYAWSRKPEHIIWEVKFKDISKKVLFLNDMYSDFELEYGILGKAGINVFTKQLPAVAILHGSIDGEKVLVKKEHIDWLFDLYDEELKDLGLYIEKREKDILKKHADYILENSTPDILHILKMISIYGSQSAIEKAGIMGRMTIYRNFKLPVKYQVTRKKDKRVMDKYYSFADGSVVLANEKDFMPDNKIPSFSKKDGTISFFGELLLEKIKNNDEELEELE